MVLGVALWWNSLQRLTYRGIGMPGGLQEGSLYLLGGFDGFAHHDVWLGTPDGIGWTLQRFTHRRESRYDVVEESKITAHAIN
eukprot:s805_g2.t1